MEKKYAAVRVRTFNLPIRILGRYPYTTGSEGICGRILLTTLGLETQKCSETVFTTSKQRTVFHSTLVHLTALDKPYYLCLTFSSRRLATIV